MQKSSSSSTLQDAKGQDRDKKTTAPSKSPPSPETLKLIEAVLDYIRANLHNIRSTWGVGSPQYKSAAEVLSQYLDDNLNKMKVERDEVEELMKGMEGLGL